MKNTIELAAEFKAYEFLSKDYRTYDASELPDGTVVNMPVWAFFKLHNPDMTQAGPIRMRDYTGSIQVVVACDSH